MTTGLRLLNAHFMLGFRILSRLPGYLIPSLAFPALFFVFFAVPYATDRASANGLLASYATVALLGVAIFQFGIGIANERVTPWDRYVRTLGVTPATRFAARILNAICFAGAAVAIVVALALTLTKAQLDAGQWLRFAAALLAGGVPFTILGIAIGYVVSPRVAVPIANLIYLPLLYAGGLWTPPEFLSGAVARISPYLPSRAFGELMWGAVGFHQTPVWAIGSLVAYSAVFTAIAFIAYRRDEGTNFA
jgi:ABC-2 type transport system permease protein